MFIITYMYYIHTMYPECLQIQIKYIINRIHIQNVFCTWSAEQVEQKIWSWSHAWLMSCRLTCKSFLSISSCISIFFCISICAMWRIMHLSISDLVAGCSLLFFPFKAEFQSWTFTFSSTLLRIWGRQSRYSPEIIHLFGNAF